MAVSEPSRVAPTVKVLDDAPYPPQVAAPGMPYTARPASIPPSVSRAQTPLAAVHGRAPTPAPFPSKPPTPVPQGSIPPGVSAQRARAQSPAVSQLSQPGMSMPFVRRPWGLISIVILVDLALAGTGAALLAKGLAARPAAGAPASGSGSAASAPAAAPAPTPPPPAPAPAPPPPPAPAPAAPHADAEPAGSATPIGTVHGGSAVAAKVPPPKHHTTTTTKGGAPVDPYTPDLNAEVELMASRSQAQFTKCYDDAAQASPVHGKIEVAFQVLPTGRVSNVQPVVNTTGSASLASCLTSAVLHWTFAAKPATATDSMRSFTYP